MGNTTYCVQPLSEHLHRQSPAPLEGIMDARNFSSVFNRRVFAFNFSSFALLLLDEATDGVQLVFSTPTLWSYKDETRMETGSCSLTVWITFCGDFGVCPSQWVELGGHGSRDGLQRALSPLSPPSCPLLPLGQVYSTAALQLFVCQLLFFLHQLTLLYSFYHRPLWCSSSRMRSAVRSQNKADISPSNNSKIVFTVIICEMISY